MAHAQASIGTVDYATAITTGHDHRLTADEGPELGGKDAGPAPYDLLSSALGACTVITLRMYAERKQWPVTAVQADIHFHRGEDKTERSGAPCSSASQTASSPYSSAASTSASAWSKAALSRPVLTGGNSMKLPNSIPGPPESCCGIIVKRIGRRKQRVVLSAMQAGDGSHSGGLHSWR